MHRYFTIYKPYNVLTQFSAIEGKGTLADYFKVPKDVYPVGRLDYDSEGLLILTNDKELNHRLLNPKYKHERQYWVQVEGRINRQAIDELQRGVIISIDGKPYKTRPCKSLLFEEPPPVYPRDPPIRFRKNIADSWISLTLFEGKNRQVRRMTAKVGFPTLRLIRYRIEKLTLDKMQPGNIIELTREKIYEALFEKNKLY
jgi:23S rRNA pseudouridine2457 synthase